MGQNNKEIRQIQLKALEILMQIDKICRKYNIQYSLCGGSVVGAYLYGGCLPWDDDIDVMMTRKNYNRFLEVCRNHLPDKYRVVNFEFSDDYYTLFTKIIDESTTLIQETDQGQIISGVFCDITVYDKIPVKGFIKHYDEFLWKLSQWCLIGKIKGSSLKVRFRNMLLSLIGEPASRYYLFLQRTLERNDRCKDYVYSEYFGSFCNTKPYDKEIFENYSEISFEGRNFMIVRDFLKYLQCRYERTDFREPKEKQIPAHYSYVNLKQSYKDYSVSTKL